jgi:hypothetical protein
MPSFRETHYTEFEMEVEPFEKLGLTGRDFVIYDESGRVED